MERVRTAPMPNWVKVAIERAAADVADGRVFQPVNRADRAGSDVLSEKVVWQLNLRQGCRRTCAKLCRAEGGVLEHIQMLLGHTSVQTTERYLGTKQDPAHAPNDAIKLRVAV